MAPPPRAAGCRGHQGVHIGLWTVHKLGVVAGGPDQFVPPVHGAAPPPLDRLSAASLRLLVVAVRLHHLHILHEGGGGGATAAGPAGAAAAAAAASWGSGSITIPEIVNNYQGSQGQRREIAKIAI